MIKAVVFDYNGSLVNDLRLHEEAYMRTAMDLDILLSRNTVRSFLSHTAEQKRIPFFGFGWFIVELVSKMVVERKIPVIVVEVFTRLLFEGSVT